MPYKYTREVKRKQRPIFNCVPWKQSCITSLIRKKEGDIYLTTNVQYNCSTEVTG